MFSFYFGLAAQDLSQRERERERERDEQKGENFILKLSFLAHAVVFDIE